MTAANESAVSFAWLTDRLRPAGSGSRTWELWSDVRDDMKRSTINIVSIQDWISDFWLCKGSVMTNVGIVPTFNPPDDIDEWSTFSTRLLSAYAPGGARPTSHDAFRSLLAQVTLLPQGGSGLGVERFYELVQATHERADETMHQAQHVRAWLTVALGNLLMSVALSPQNQPDQVAAEVQRRLLIPRALKAAPKWGIAFAEGEIGLLYNCRQQPSGYISWEGIRVGQGEEWMKHWQWLSAPLEAEQMLGAVKLSAELLRSEPLLNALLIALDADDEGCRHIALAVLRRWLLSLKAMAWLEHALRSEWRTVRPQDLACFAFNALKPVWPRHFLAISHRSKDAKPVLRTTRAWNSSLFAIDANCIPSWETNTGMIWGLFAVTPVIAKVESPHYRESVWCQREAELVGHLQRRCDFLSRRYVLDAELEQLSEMDHIDEAWRANSFGDATSALQDYPPYFQVYTPAPKIDWELAMLRGAAALRIFSAAYHGVERANGLARLLLSDDRSIPFPPPTNHPGGWNSYRRVFRELASQCGANIGVDPLLFPEETVSLGEDEARRITDMIPDLSGRTSALDDVLAAVEWQTTILPLLLHWNMGDAVLIDLRDRTLHEWRENPHLSMSRGIAALRAPARPIWLIQRSDQQVDTWGLGGDRPIFTEYSDGQFTWMLEMSLSPEWTASYADHCGLIMCAELESRCRKTASS